MACGKELKPIDFNPGKQFSVTPHPVHDLQSLAKLIDQLEGEPKPHFGSVAVPNDDIAKAVSQCVEFDRERDLNTSCLNLFAVCKATCGRSDIEHEFLRIDQGLLSASDAGAVMSHRHPLQINDLAFLVDA